MKLNPNQQKNGQLINIESYEMSPMKQQIYFCWGYLDNFLIRNDQLNSISSNSSINLYKNAVGDFPLYSGNISYWQIKILHGNNFKIGISSIKDKNNNQFKGSISDQIFGYSYYSQGQLRHNSSDKGIQYGVGYGEGDEIGILFNQQLGELSFFVNNSHMGIAFKEKIFNEQIFYPFVSCLIENDEFLLMLPEKED